MTDQVYSMGQNRNKESGHDEEKKEKVLVPTSEPTQDQHGRILLQKHPLYFW